MHTYKKNKRSVIAAIFSFATPTEENRKTAALSRIPNPPKEMGIIEINRTMGIKTKKYIKFILIPIDSPI